MGTLMAKLAEELKQILRSYGLPLSGRKEELANRILDHEHNGSLVQAVGDAASGIAAQSTKERWSTLQRITGGVKPPSENRAPF